MDDEEMTPEQDRSATTDGPAQASRGVGRAIVEGAGSGIAAAARGVRALGLGVGAIAARGWRGLTTGREQRAEARIEAAREAARLRASELGGPVAPKSIHLTGEPEAGAPIEVEPEPEPEEEPEAEPEAGASIEVEPEPEPEEEPEPEPESEPEPEEEPEPEPGPEVKEEESGPSASVGSRVRALSGRGVGMLGAAVAGTRGALAKAGKALAPAGAAMRRGVVAGGHAVKVGFIRVGKALGPAGAAIGTGLVVTGRGIGRALARAGRSLGSIGGAAFDGAGRALRRLGDAIGRRIRRVRGAWAGRPPRPRLWISIGAALVIIVSYTLAQASVASRVAPNTTVLGVDVGGVPVEEARSLLEGRIVEISTAAVSLSAHGRVVVMDPEELGLSIDVEATLDSLSGFSWSPSTLWRHAAGAGPIEPVVVVDEAVFTEAMDKVATMLSQDARDAEALLGPMGVSVQASQDGVDVDANDIAQTVLDAWPSDSPIAVPIEVTPATRDTEEAQRFARTVNGIVLGSPVVLSSPNGSVTLTPEDVIAHGSIVQDGPLFGLAVDEDALGALILERLPGLENAAVNARFAFDSKHQLYVRPGVPARTLDLDALEDEVVLTIMSATRAGEIPLVETPPAVTTEDLENSDFQELISTYYTEFTPREPSREHNIANAASKIVGYVVQPGEEFSITNAIGPITGANGYISAGVIVGGVHTNGMGGGLCQIATTSYVAAYLAGYEIVERRGHTEWFSRYPAGRDAAITTGVDMRFRNDTPYAMMFNAYVENTGLRVDIWSTPYYTVEASSSAKYNITGGGYRIKTETPCYPSSPKSGFTITDTRKIYLDGVLLKTENRVSVYRAVSGTKCA